MQRDDPAEVVPFAGDLQVVFEDVVAVGLIAPEDAGGDVGGDDGDREDGEGEEPELFGGGAGGVEGFEFLGTDADGGERYAQGDDRECDELVDEAGEAEEELEGAENSQTESKLGDRT